MANISFPSPSIENDWNVTRVTIGEKGVVNKDSDKDINTLVKMVFVSNMLIGNNLDDKCQKDFEKKLKFSLTELRIRFIGKNEKGVEKTEEEVFKRFISASMNLISATKIRDILNQYCNLGNPKRPNSWAIMALDGDSSDMRRITILQEDFNAINWKVVASVLFLLDESNVSAAPSDDPKEVKS